MMSKLFKNRLSQSANFFVVGPKFLLNVLRVRLASNFTHASNFIQLRKSHNIGISQSANFKNLFVVLGFVLFVIPQTSFAASGRRTEATATPVKASFCSAVDAFADKMKKDMAENESKFFSKDSDRQAQIDDKFAKQDAERQNTRFTWDNSRDKVYTNLLARATTESQKAAIKKFRSSIDIAVEVRRKSVDAANANFKASVDGGAKQRKSAIENATKLFKSDADKALVIAKTDCDNGKASLDARAVYVKSLEDAQKKLQGGLSKIKNDTSLSAFVNTRQAAIEQAGKDFKAAVTKTENELKASFPDA